MKTLFLGSVVERSGKSMVTLGLAKNYPGKVGYFKPFKEVVICEGDRVIDQDAYLMKKVLGLQPSEEMLSPFTYNMLRPVDMGSIVDSYEKVKDDADLMLVEGTRDITTGCLQDISGMAIAGEIGAQVVLISTTQLPALDKICMLKRLMEHYRLTLRGVILNMAEDSDIKKLLEEKGVPILGSIPSMRELKRFRAREVVDTLNADVLAGEQGLDKLVERVMIGAMTPEIAITHMRRVSRKAIITGGDRADIQMAALSTDTSCLVLTGGLYPAKPVIAKAHETGIPLLLVRYNTLEAAEMVDHLIARIDPSDSEKIDMIAGAVRTHVDLEAVWGD
jgi:BioD-like phosphotransacetylase family protein